MLAKVFQSVGVMACAGWVAKATGLVVGAGWVDCVVADGPVVGLAPARLWAWETVAEKQNVTTAAANASHENAPARLGFLS